MSNAGKYVRAPVYESDLESENEFDDSQVNSPGRYVRTLHSDGDSIDVYTAYKTTVDPDQENRELRERVLELEKSIAEIAGMRSCGDDRNRESNPVTPAFVPTSPPTVMSLDNGAQNIRWDNIKPFPKGVPANKLWEAWTKFFENFEIAASLSNAYDPVKRFHLLYLSIGDELQGIVRAAKLRPDSIDANCYGVFVKNIEEYLKALTDTSAEHDAFSSMQQEKGESAVNFHARLMEKVWLCGYSPSDQDRFVRTQLLKGLRNRELAKAARTYGHDTNFVVQSATRDEALQPEPPSLEGPTSILAVSRSFSRDVGMKRQLSKPDERGIGFRPKHFRGDGRPSLQRYERCSRCNRAAHGGQRCPALDKNCNSCGRRGHFSATCRRKRVNMCVESNSPVEAFRPQVKLANFNEEK
ncbi:uncharacterized protein LOC131688772 [Topomyia yanbarensis]|uniref:uncharacterized protein LOC131688770 n=1 Tax=Topomyia yanbarensis TaxID=2498891 RepID=UPI00273C907A|nr:uncharacterized protein LOC131688770 [Topomyia yanbarensis]XP_058829268.1 uncharacterized protein LOC131688772 [Topomyia yanbarensis]